MMVNLVRKAHNESMELAEEASLSRVRRGDPEYRRGLFVRACDAEVRALELKRKELESGGDYGGSLSLGVLYRSASWLAWNAGDLGRSERLACEGLLWCVCQGEEKRDRVGWIAEELRDVLRVVLMGGKWGEDHGVSVSYDNWVGVVIEKEESKEESKEDASSEELSKE